MKISVPRDGKARALAVVHEEDGLFRIAEDGGQEIAATPAQLAYLLQQIGIIRVPLDWASLCGVEGSNP